MHVCMLSVIFLAGCHASAESPGDPGDSPGSRPPEHRSLAASVCRPACSVGQVLHGRDAV